MVESAVINEMEADLTEMTGFYEKSTRVHVKALLEKEVNKIKDLILIVKILSNKP